VFRGDDKVAGFCGSGKLKLQSGTYRIKTAGDPSFEPMTVSIANGETTTVNFTGGVFELEWPGGVCFYVYRGETLAGRACGGTQELTLQAGNYTVKTVGDPVFEPFATKVEAGKKTKVKMGGVFKFNWPGDDFWYVYRGSELACRGQGSSGCALQAGSYTVKPLGRAFEPFEIAIEDGVTLTAP
jgi:hypothetical protein